MKVSFNKQMKVLEREVLLKSVDLDDDIEDFNFEFENYQSEDTIILIASNCVRCNLCVEECPVDAIEDPNLFKTAKITDKCVKCEICVQTCPVSNIKLINSISNIDKGSKEGVEDIPVEYELSSIIYPHRVIRMNDIFVDYFNCVSCGDCDSFCPTNALKLDFGSFKEGLDEEKLYPVINKKICIGCGSCAHLCPESAINLDRIMGPVLDTKILNIYQDKCVNCYLCEDNCPVEAIKIIDGEVVLNKEKCIRCNSCSYNCPVGALELVKKE